MRGRSEGRCGGGFIRREFEIRASRECALMWEMLDMGWGEDCISSVAARRTISSIEG